MYLSWYDREYVIREIVKKGYFAVIKPVKNRLKGFYRRKIRKNWIKDIRYREGYKQRARGESIFGSLAN
jgi:hypothetical protein